MIMTRDPDTPAEAVVAGRRARLRTLPRLLAAGVLVYLAVAYLVLPYLWRRLEYRHPELVDAPQITCTAGGIPGDPLNIALVGTEEEIHQVMSAAKWFPADPTTLKSALRIAADATFRRPYA